jgi:mxaD protein
LVLLAARDGGMRKVHGGRLFGSRPLIGFVLTALFIGLTCSMLWAHGATPIKIEEKIEIHAKPEALWQIIGGFAQISAWNPSVTSSVAASDDRQGQERVMTLKSGGKMTDALTEYDAGKMTYSYRRVDDDVQIFPVSFYSATISLSPTATGTEVDWVGKFYRGDTSNEPPENLNDEVATKAMTDFFEAGLNNLKKLAEKSPRTD